MISAGKSKFLNVIYNVDFLECKSGIGTKFVNLLRYNPKVTKPRFFHLKVEKKEDNYIFYKDLTRDEYEGEENIKEVIHNINEQLKAEPLLQFDDLFYMTEINESKFIRDEKYLLTHDLCDIPGLSEYQGIKKEEKTCEKKDIIEEKIEKTEDFNKLRQEGAKNFSIFSPEKEEKEETININGISETENFEDDIYKEVKNIEENTYLTEIFKIIKNNIDGGIIILSVENYFVEENFKIIAKLHKTLGKEIIDFLVIFNKIDLSINPKVDIENCKGMLIQKFQKFQAFNLNLNTFIPLSLIQLQNELLMSTSFKYLINCYFDKYLSNIKNSSESELGESFIEHLITIIKAVCNKTREEIESKVEELNESENINEINEEIILILKELKEKYKTNKFVLGISEKDFNENIKDEILPDEIDEMIEIEKINPSYILKYLYICQKQKESILMPPLSSNTNRLLNYFKYEKNQIIFENEQREKENILQQTKLNKEIIKHLQNLNEKFGSCKIFVDDIQKIIEELKNTIYFLEIYDVIFIPFIGQPNAGKSTIINSIIGKKILPIGLHECTKRGIIIKYWDKEEIYISRAFLKIEKINDKNYYFFEEKKFVGKGETNVVQTLNGLNREFNNKEEDAFFFVRTKIKLFDDLQFNDYYKKMIYLIDFPGFGTGENNFFEKNEIYKKTMNICNSFIFVVRNSIIKDDENHRMLNEIYENAKEQKKQFSSKFIKSCLFILNNDINQPTEKKDLEIARDEINDLILGIKKEDIKLCFFNAEYYLNYGQNFNYFFNLDETFKIEYNNFIIYNEKLYENPGKNKKYNSFYEYLYKKIMERIKKEKICDDKGIPKTQKINENCLNEIKEIVKKEPFNNDRQFNKYHKYIAQLFSFAQENINQIETYKNSNI